MDVSGVLLPYFTLETAQIILAMCLGIFLANSSLGIWGKWRSLKQKYSFLEIKSTDRALKSSLSTSQLFIALHSLQKPLSRIHKLLGIKKSISFEMVSSKNEGIRYIFRAPSEDISIIRKTLLAYLPGIEVLEIKDYLPESFINNTSSIVREYILNRKYIFPVRDHTTLDQHDPVSFLTAQMTKLSPHEMMCLQIISFPVHESTHPRITQLVHELNKRLLGNEDILKFITKSKAAQYIELSSLLIVFACLSPFTLISWLLSNSNNPLPTWIFSSHERNNKSIGKNSTDLQSQISHKISQSLFDCTIRVCIASQDSHQTKNRLKGITAAMAVFDTSSQSFKLKPSIGNIIKTELIRKLYRYLYRQRIIFTNSHVILSVNELSSMYHFPFTSSTKTEDLILVKSPNLPAPLSLKKDNTVLDITFAENTYGESTTPIGLTLEERRRHAYIIGATGTGKTTLLQHMIYQDLIKGNGLAVIDPHGDLAEKIIGVIPEHRIKDVIYFDPYDVEFPIGLNVLELPPGLNAVELQREKDFITSTLVSIFQKLYDKRYSGPRMEHILRNVVLTALELENPTLFTIYQLLTDKKYRKNITSNLDDEILKTFWTNEFDIVGSFQRAEMVTPITNKLGRFYTTIITRNILNQTKSKLDFDTIMNNGKILICNLSKGRIGEDTAYFLGNLLTAKIQLTALRRVHIPENDRKDFFLYIDEFQNFATMSFAQILSEARKYRLSVTLAHQNTVQIEDDLLETIIGNTGTIIGFRTTSPTDESKLLPIFTPEVLKGQISNLPSYHFYIKINALQPQATFSGSIENFTHSPNEQIRQHVIDSSRVMFGSKAEPKKQTKQLVKKIEKSQTTQATITNLFEAI